MTILRKTVDWIDDQARRRKPVYELATDNRIYVAVVLLAVVTGMLSGLYS